MGNCSSKNEAQPSSCKSERTKSGELEDGQKAQVLIGEPENIGVTKEKNIAALKEISQDEENNENDRKRPEKLNSLDIGEDDENTDGNHISGLAITEQGFLLVSDSDQNNIKCLSPDNKCISILDLDSSPNEVTALGKTRAAIGTEEGVYILNIDKLGLLSIDKKIEMDHEVWGIAEYRGNLLITCDTRFKSTKLIDLNGHELWSFSSVETEKWRENLFEYPCDVAWAAINNKDTVIVVDAANDSITLLDAGNGNYIGRKKNVDQKPERITVDKDNNVYICMSGTAEIWRWKNNFKERERFLDFDDLGNAPLAIHISNRLGCLYVAYPDDATIDRFKLI